MPECLVDDAVLTMKKIRINELARELEVKPNVIIDMLPELGVGEKKTHSSSIDEDVSLVIRKRLAGRVGLHFRELIPDANLPIHADQRRFPVSDREFDILENLFRRA